MTLLKFAVLGVCLILGVSYLFSRDNSRKAPNLGNAWWGPGKEHVVADTVRPFKVNFSKKEVEDLRQRLRNTRPSKPALEDTAWTYGVDSAFMPEIIDYWLNKYNFTEREEYLNQYPQFTTNIQGLDIHFLHVKPKNSAGKRVLPLLMQHGWPGSVVEFYKIIPMLTTPRDGYDFVFEVIAPSLPGFGFSSGTTKPGLGPTQMAIIMKNLMLRLGVNKFYTQGGDWGFVVTSNLAALFPQHVLGMHSNLCAILRPRTFIMAHIYSLLPPMLVPGEDDQQMHPLSPSQNLEETGYLHLQSTKPDTLGISLADSPAGLAAWILEKFSTLTNPEMRLKANGGLLDMFSADELLDNVMLYWIPNSMTTAVRIYAEFFNSAQIALGMDYVPVNVPSACAQFPYEIWYQPSSVLRTRFKNLVRVQKMPRGGHFAAFEEPALLADEVWTSIGIMEAKSENSA